MKTNEAMINLSQKDPFLRNVNMQYNRSWCACTVFAAVDPKKAAIERARLNEKRKRKFN